MSDLLKKKAILKTMIGDQLAEVMVKTRIDNVYLTDNVTKLSTKLAEIIEQLNDNTDALDELTSGETGIATLINKAVETLKDDRTDEEKAENPDDVLVYDTLKKLQDAIKANADAITKLNGAVTVEGSVLQMVKDNAASAIYAPATEEAAAVTIAEAIKANTDAVAAHKEAIDTKVSTLVGEDTNKSVRTIANEELATQLIPENAKESLDTLQEIAAWIQAHPDDASAMNKAIGDLQTLVGTIPTHQVADENGVEPGEDGYIETLAPDYASIVAMIKGVDAAMDTRVDALEAAIGAEGSVAAAIKNAVEALDAEKEGSYTDGIKVKVTEVDGKLDAVEVSDNGLAAKVAATVKADAKDATYKAAEGEDGVAVTIADAIGALETAVGTTSVADQIKAAVEALDAEVASAEVEAGKGVKVSVTEVDGKITTVSVEGNYDEAIKANAAAGTYGETTIGAAIGALEALPVFKASETQPEGMRAGDMWLELLPDDDEEEEPNA